MHGGMRHSAAEAAHRRRMHSAGLVSLLASQKSLSSEKERSVSVGQLTAETSQAAAGRKLCSPHRSCGPAHLLSSRAPGLQTEAGWLVEQMFEAQVAAMALSTRSKREFWDAMPEAVKALPKCASRVFQKRHAW
jgi:hypothetical protein